MSVSEKIGQEALNIISIRCEILWRSSISIGCSVSITSPMGKREKHNTCYAVKGNPLVDLRERTTAGSRAYDNMLGQGATKRQLIV